VTSTKVSVSVAVKPDVAFRAFTDELDLWWVRGPINYFDSGRAIAMRCEHGVGGRLVEVYDEASGEGLELAYITAWEPPTRLAWKSSLDDVEIDVRFTPDDSGTEVTVEASLPEGGVDRGGSAWVRVVPRWFTRWCDRRDEAPRPQPELGRLAVGVFYSRPAAAARWLGEVFALESPDPLPSGEDPLPDTEHGHPWIELRAGRSSIILFKGEGVLRSEGSPTHAVWVYVDDVEQHLARATAGGARIVTPLRHSGYTAYEAEDLEGHRWVFAQARPGQR